MANFYIGYLLLCFPQFLSSCQDRYLNNTILPFSATIPPSPISCTLPLLRHYPYHYLPNITLLTPLPFHHHPDHPKAIPRPAPSCHKLSSTTLLIQPSNHQFSAPSSRNFPSTTLQTPSLFPFLPFNFSLWNEKQKQIWGNKFVPPH